MTTARSFFSTLSSNYALMLSGQGSTWKTSLDELLELPETGKGIRTVLRQATQLLSPIELQLRTHAPGALDRLHTIIESEKNSIGTDNTFSEDATTNLIFDREAGVSVPGIVLSQLGALIDLHGSDLDIHQTPPIDIVGHSQGMMGVALAKAFIAEDFDKLVHIVALSILIGHAVQYGSHHSDCEARSDRTPMLSIRGVNRSFLEQNVTLPQHVTIALINDHESTVFSGYPHELEELKNSINHAVNTFNSAIEKGERGGSLIQQQYDYLPVSAPFHSPLLEPGVKILTQWLTDCHYPDSHDEALDLARLIMTEPVDWPTQLHRVTQHAQWLLDMGPSHMVGRLSAPTIAGSGCTIVSASSHHERIKLDTAGHHVQRARSWNAFAPQLVKLPQGRTVIDNAFTRLTGRSPIVLPAMTPTTVSPEIVAAAANAGAWAEMAGGGQYSEQVFHENLTGLKDLLEPGRTAGFNAMFFDRFMWNLQFGVQRIVPKARQAGAPIDGVTIAAGIPEREEAAELIEQLQADGFSYICFKPGTVDQIKQVLAIAKDNADTPLIIQVEDGHAGGHHSWENLDDLLLATYATIREVDNLVLVVGGGIGTPQRAADYITGRWAYAYQRPAMPVDAVMLGTASMAVKEARTSQKVKQALLETEGIADGWVGRGQSRGGITSGLSHLDADMYEIDNSSAKASRLIHQIGHDQKLIDAHRDELITALNKTAKPYFGDLLTMTYHQWAQRLIDLMYPYKDWTWQDRLFDIFHRIEARLHHADHGSITTIFPDFDSLEDAPKALDLLLEHYPGALTQKVHPSDAAWFKNVCNKHPKPVPFVAALTTDIARAWGTDTLMQAHDDRYDADAVRIIPGPVSVRGIDRINEPIGEMFTRYEDHIVAQLRKTGVELRDVFSRFRAAQDIEHYVRNTPIIQWNGNMVVNPAMAMPDATSIITSDDEHTLTIRVHCDTAFEGASQVKYIDIPLTLPSSCSTGGYPVVDMERMSVNAYDLLGGAAGVGTTTVNGDNITEMPLLKTAEKSSQAPFGVAYTHFTFDGDLGKKHRSVTGEQLLAEKSSFVPDALVGPCWPAIYTALGSAYYDDVPVIEGLVNAVHLDHTLHLIGTLPPTGSTVEVRSFCHSLTESSAGRVVQVNVVLSFSGHDFAQLVERFAIRGRVTTTEPPADPPALSPHHMIVDTPRSFLRSTTVKAPQDMTAFAHVSGDFNPIHTSYAAAGLSGLHAPLVHGMWLSATVQHVIAARHISDVSASAQQGVIRGYHQAPLSISHWSYAMYGMVNLGDEVDITVERIGRLSGGDQVIEAICRIGNQVVSTARAVVSTPTTVYVYPGQGIQRKGMGMESMSPVVRNIWKRADKHTRAALGFSIESIVRDNPTEIRIGTTVLRHPQGVLHLTQFTQVALATLAYAQTSELKARGAFVDDAFFAGHSLGEYNALAACANIFPLEQVLEIVYQRGSAMHDLVERDSHGQSNYRLGALRPHQCGIGAEKVQEYVDSIAEKTGEFIEIANYNLAGEQYAVAGTIAGLAALEKDALARSEQTGGKRPFILIPGIDVPFHSSVLRAGVSAFRGKLDELLPETINADVLINRYIPNLVARPFELTPQFAQSICDTVPSQAVEQLLHEDWAKHLANPGRLARTLLIELLAWQFASPVRWIDTQNILFDAPPTGCGVERLVEIGLASSPTLANLADKTLAHSSFYRADVEVLHYERDFDRVCSQDVAIPPAPSEEIIEDVTVHTPSHHTSTGGSCEASAGSAPTPVVPEKAAAPALLSDDNHVVDNNTPKELPMHASDAIRVLLAYSTKVTPDQIDDSDTIDTLTNGVSSKRNQLLMDIAAELGVTAIDGAAEASIRDLLTKIDDIAGAYQPFGSVLTQAIGTTIRHLLGAAGLPSDYIDKRITSRWNLGNSWITHVQAALLLGTREGQSVRGGDLLSLNNAVTTAGEVDDLIDAAVTQVGAAHGFTLVLPSSTHSSSGAMVDSGALSDLREEILGDSGILATQARFILSQLSKAPYNHTGDKSNDMQLVEAVTQELGEGWLDSVAPSFDPLKAVVLDDRWATLREDLTRIFHGGLEALGNQAAVTAPREEGSHKTSNDTAACDTSLIAKRLISQARGSGKTIAHLAKYYADQLALASEHDSKLCEFFTEVSQAATQRSCCQYSNDIALVTGAAPNSIAHAIVGKLLTEGATVVMTASRIDNKRLHFAKELYRTYAHAQAKLWIVPANLSSFRDVDALIEWIGSEHTQTVGPNTTVLKPSLLPTLFFPFAAPSVYGTVGSDPAQALSQERLLVWSVERCIHLLAHLGESTAPDHKVHVILPGSPNRGTFGGDGAYGEAKAAFDAIVNKWSTESGWPTRITLAHPLIGWVQGTGLMGGNDGLVPSARDAGIEVFTPDAIADRLMELMTYEARTRAAHAPIIADLSGGLATADIDLAAMAQAARQTAGDTTTDTASPSEIFALPNATPPTLASPLPWKGVTTALADQIVVVGLGELSAWGSGRTRVLAEYSDNAPGDIQLSAQGVIELAWMMGLISWADSPREGWYDTEGSPVDEAHIYARYHDEVIARCGIRTFSDDSSLTDRGSMDVRTVYLPNEQVFSVQSRKEAESYLHADPSHTEIFVDNGEWKVVKKAGSAVHIPRHIELTRSVGGQIPDNFDPTHWGIPPTMVEALDRIAVWNLVTAVDAFVSAGFSPMELLQSVHPSAVSTTQGTGIGGMESLRQVFLDRFLGNDRPQDILQEALPNVVAAHTMQSYIGGYGQMIHSVGACATAAVSVEEAVDKIRLGKSDFVVAGGIDDISVESLTGFGDMNATARSSELRDKGISSRYFSRAGDRRRAGFVEAAGGGTVLVTRGDIAADLGLPVYAVIGFAQSFSDGAHTSIPAPGIGALAAACGQKTSHLARSLHGLGINADDIAVVSKHDTSTHANDPNEAELHTRLAKALGRTPGNPLYVVSQKSLTGHAKGGAALFQLAGLCDAFTRQELPGNMSLDCLDPQMRPYSPLVWLRRPLQCTASPLKAGVLTSLGFGHVSALIVLVHPSAFETALRQERGDAAADKWRTTAQQRLQRGWVQLQQAMRGKATLFVPLQGRRLPVDTSDTGSGIDPHEVEAAMLLNPKARLAQDGIYHADS
ncbi:MAG: DUF1729 domain-containing protein [Actinomycetaceae bacterium]|nr:DUF1729 domain-containing protein [Actinomycetaceae bacterium]